ncbi:hypothetical protein BV20DRAFT_625036 [Pilatotrama ljubarskyi]|nr:hypothetical protein BV20DRAFT_625036 [Pilatotrama ljubarskyi]
MELLEVANHVVEFDQIGVPFPALRSLLVKHGLASVQIDVLVRKLPALDGTLDTGSSSMCDSDDVLKLSGVAALYGIHQLNLLLQAQRSWKQLDRLAGPVLFLFVLAVACPVRHLMVDGFWGREEEQLLAILRLTSHAAYSPQIDYLVVRTLPHLRSPVSTASHSQVDPPSARISWTAYWNNVLSKIVFARLVHIRSIFRDVCGKRSPSGPASDSRGTDGYYPQVGEKLSYWDNREDLVSESSERR